MTDARPFDRRAIPAGARLSTWTAADGWRLRRFDWPADGAQRGAILFQGGRGDIVEKYLESFAHWHAAGWSVSGFDWRGQGGSGRVAADPHVGHIGDFRAYLDDFEGFWRAWQPQAGPGPRVLMGHSMGGHLVLRALVEGLARPDAAVLIAPMLGLHSPLGARAGEWLARTLARAGDPSRAAWKANEIPAARATRQALLTHDLDRYADEAWWQAHMPALKLGPPSWRWVARAFQSTRALATDPRLVTLDVPVLMLVAEADRLVRPAAAYAIARRLPDCEVERFGGESAHEILRESDAVRDRALARIDGFLDAHAPAR